MINKKMMAAIAAALVLLTSIGTPGQKPRLGRICGDPTLPCVGTEDSSPWVLNFAVPKRAVIYQSENFYMIILKSKKLKDNEDCTVVFPEDERLGVQPLFPHNKVFSMKCFEAGDISYANVAYDVAFLGVFAGRTMAEAKAMLERVKATGKFPGAMIRKTHAEVNGT
jgi:hypothetical protein